MSRSRGTLSGVLILGVLGTLALLLAASPWSESSGPARTQTDCPGVDKAFEEAGVEPIDFDNGCPEQPEQLAEDVSEATDQISRTERVVLDCPEADEALKEQNLEVPDSWRGRCPTPGEIDALANR